MLPDLPAAARPRSTLVVIGAGPKAMAIAAKVTALAELGFAAPEVHIIERAAVGAHWNGRSGYTNGRQPLGTSPEKDVGFPYDSSAWGPELGRAIDECMTRFSWQSFLVATNGYSDWVDRGRPAPEHREWASYLVWIAGQTAGRVHLVTGEVVGLRLSGARWCVLYRRGDENHAIAADGLVMTGPGRVRSPAGTPAHPRVLTVETFWRDRALVEAPAGGRVAIVGTGETAAAVACALVERAPADLAIDVISPVGAAYSRGESYRENRVYSDPDRGRWAELTSDDRREFIRRTDRGVFSQAAQRVLDAFDAIDVVPARLDGITIGEDDRPVLALSYDARSWSASYDRVILATGGDPLAFVDGLLDDASRRCLVSRSGLAGFAADAVEAAIGYDLAVRGLEPRLHLPMLAGLAQGPGFANLSCLGRLSDRILEPYVRRAAAPVPRRELERSLASHELRIGH
jgi:mycobactin lysine-N-oxygenase